MKGKRKDDKGGKRGLNAADAYNPLDGNRRFFENLRDGYVPDETRTVEPPAYDAQGKIFKPRKPEEQRQGKV